MPVFLRLSGEQNFLNTYRHGKRFRGVLVQLTILKTKTEKSRLAVVVSRKISNLATKRNLYKRRIWGCLRGYRRFIPINGYNLVFTALPAIKNTTYQELDQEIGKLISKIGK